MTSKNTSNWKRVIAATLIAVMVLSVVTPFMATGVAADGDGGDSGGGDHIDGKFIECSNSNVLLYAEECQDTLTSHGDVFAQYANIGKLYRYIETNSFFQDSSATTCTPYARAGDYAFRYCHQQQGNGNVDVWVKQVYELDGENNQDGEFSSEDIDLSDQPETRIIKKSNPSGTVDEKTQTQEEINFFEVIARSFDSVKLQKDSNNGNDGSDNSKDSNLVSLGKLATSEAPSRQGSIVDYDLNRNQPLSVFVTQFKDSQTADEMFEYKSMPPYSSALNGDVSNFNRMTSVGGQAKVDSATTGLQVGFGIYRVPDPSQSAHLVIDSDRYPNDVQLVVVDNNGDTLQKTEFSEATKLNHDVRSAISEQNAIHFKLVSDSDVGKLQISCASVVLDAKSTPNKCNVGQVQREIPDLGQGGVNEGDNLGDGTIASSGGDSTAGDRGGTILNYDMSGVAYSESIQYTSSYVDGDGDTGYLEQPLPLSGSASGTVTEYPKMLDSDPSTPATMNAANKGGLNVATAIQNAPLGQNHVFVMKYEVEKGEKPDVYIETYSGHKVKVPAGDLKKGQFDKIAVDISGLSKYINNNGAVFIRFQSNDAQTRVQVYCASVIANVQNPDAVNCSGSAESQSSNTVSVSSNIGSQVTENFAPRASIDAPSSTRVGDSTLLSAASSYDSDGTIEKYKWTINGETYTGRQIQKKFSSQGTQQVKLTITDDNGKSDTARINVNVKPAQYTLYTYTKKIIETKTKTSTTKPGPGWAKGKQVGTKGKVTFKKSTTKPGQGYVKVKQVGTKKVQQTRPQFSVESSTCDSPGYCGSDLKINGNDVYTSRGLNIVIMNSDGTVDSYGVFDVHGHNRYFTVNNPSLKDGFNNPGFQNGNADAKAQQFLESAEKGQTVVVVGDDQPDPDYRGEDNDQVEETLADMGASFGSQDELNYRDSYIFVARVGSGAVIEEHAADGSESGVGKVTAEFTLGEGVYYGTSPPSGSASGVSYAQTGQWTDQGVVDTITKVVDTKTKRAEQKPGSGWTRVKQVGTNGQLQTKRAADKPGSGWTKVKQVVDKPGGTTQKNFGASKVEISGSHYVTSSNGGASFYYAYNAGDMDEIFSSGVSRLGYYNGEINWHDDNQVEDGGVPEETFAWKYEGWIYAPETGQYRFGTDSDDASDVYVDGQKVASWYGGHGAEYFHKGSYIQLEKGWHKIKYRVEEGGGGEVAELGWETPSDGSMDIVPAKRLADNPQKVDASLVHGKGSSSSKISAGGSGSIKTLDFSSDSLNDFESLWNAQGDGDMHEWENNGDKIRWSEAGYGDDTIKYTKKVSDMNGKVTLDLYFHGNSYESSGVAFYAVDAGGDKHYFRCNPDDSVDCDGAGHQNEDSYFTWNGDYTVTADQNFKKVVVKSEMDDCCFDDGDSSDLYRIGVEGTETFQKKLDKNHGMMFQMKDNYIRWAEKNSDGRIKYSVSNVPTNDGEVTVDYKLSTHSFEGGGVNIYAVDADGDKKVIRCMGTVSQISTPGCSNNDGEVSWDTSETINMDSEIQKVVLASDLENVEGRWYDYARLYHLNVKSDGVQKYKWKKDTRTPVYKWKKKVTEKKEIHKYTRTKKKPVYKWKKDTKKPVYKWKKQTTKQKQVTSVSKPGDSTKVVGNVQKQTVSCDAGQLANKASECKAG